MAVGEEANPEKEILRFFRWMKPPSVNCIL